MTGGLFLDTAAMEWENGLDVVKHMNPEFGRNLGPPDEVAKVYVKYKQKTLRIDPETTQRLDFIHLDPGYADLTDAYHDSVEECLFLSGECDLSGEGHFVAGDYFWRPPGWVHSARTPSGFTALLMLEGISEGDGSGPVSRRIRPAEEAGTNAITKDRDRAIGPRGWVRCLHTDLVAWQPGPAYARGQGQLDDFDLEHASFKVLSANPTTGAQSLLVRVQRGYRQKAPGRHSSAVEFFVLDGSLQMGGRELEQGSYVYRPERSAEPPVESEHGARLFMKVKGRLDFERTPS
jgi:ChrR Cupin-like domain